MSWAVWLSVPAAVTALAALGSWWRSRPRRAPTTDEAMRAHGEFLHAIVQPARAKDRGPHSD